MPDTNPWDGLLSDLKDLTGASETDGNRLKLALRITWSKVLTELNQTTMPKMLEPIVLEMAADAFRLNSSADGGNDAGKIAGTISSVSDNGQSVSFRDSSYQSVLASVAQVFRNYEPALSRYRKSGW